jgi:hypothetical protein
MPESYNAIASYQVDDDVDEGLTSAEDDELRQLTWFSMVGQLSETAKERILELRAKDRRSRVRNPRPDPTASRGVDDDVRAVPVGAAAPESPSVITCPNCGFVQRSLGRQGQH